MSLPEVDAALFLFLNRTLQNSLSDVVMPAVSQYPLLAMAPFLLWACIARKTELPGVIIAAILGIALSDSIGHLLKDLIARPRPCAVMEDINLLVGCGRSFSMPSNHSANAFALASVFLIRGRDAAAYALLSVASLIAFSRVAVGVHYPSDVLVGGLLGVLSGAAAVAASRVSLRLAADRNYARGLILILAAISIFRIYFILTGPLDLSPDEAHYWEWSRRPDLSYYSKGPLIAYLILLGTKVFGTTVVGVRFFAVLFSGLGGLLLYRLGRTMYDERTGFVAALLLQVVPLFSAFGILFTIDAPFIFFWILSLFLFQRTLEQSLFGRTTLMHWIVLGFSIGCGMLAKYTMVFFGVCGLLLMLARKEWRPLFRTAGPYTAGLACLLVFTPVIFWNWANDWLTLRHTAGQAHLAAGFRISLADPAEFVGSQFGVVTPVLFVMVIAAVWKGRATRQGALLFWFSAPILVFFLVKSLQAKVQANWALPAYLAGIVAFSASYGHDLLDGKGRRKAAALAAVLLALAVTIVAHYPAVLKLKEKQDPTARLLGWKALGSEASRVVDEMQPSGPVFVFSDSYQVASELAFYMKDNPVTYCANLGRRMNQYDLWPGFENRIGHNALFVRTKDKDLPAEIGAAFAQCNRRLFAARPRKDREVKFTLFQCYDFRGLPQRPFEHY